MGDLNKSDLLVALIFGGFISPLCFQMQSSRNDHNIHKKELQLLTQGEQVLPSAKTKLTVNRYQWVNYKFLC